MKHSIDVVHILEMSQREYNTLCMLAGRNVNIQDCPDQPGCYPILQTAEEQYAFLDKLNSGRRWSV